MSGANGHPVDVEAALREAAVQPSPGIGSGVLTLPDGRRIVALKVGPMQVPLSGEQARMVAMQLLDAASLALCPVESMKKLVLAAETGLVVAGAGG